ncbi:MAG: NAD(P)-dependent oxidoreductase [Verrucomicrobia bacterium]|nr:NAD(P)-dependent oxidoreductase [Verrucomicrobiota bacterium]
MKKRVLVTGASGFIGCHTLPLLRERGYEVIPFSSKSCDLLREKIDLSEIAPSHLLHFAWNTAHGKLWDTEENLAWVKASIDLIKAFAEAGGERLVIAGTCAEYDWNASEFNEDASPAHPHTLYGSCKTALHLIAKAYAKQKGLSFAWGRVFNLYGPAEQPRRFVPAVIRGMLRNERVPCSHGNQIRDYLHVADVASAFVSLLDSSICGAVNIGSGEGVALRELVRLLGAEAVVDYGALTPPPLDPPVLVAEAKRLRQEAGWSPRYALADGLKEVRDWWRAQSE